MEVGAFQAQRTLVHMPPRATTIQPDALHNPPLFPASRAVASHGNYPA